MPDIHCREDSAFDTAEIAGTDYVLAAGSDIAAVGIVSAPVADQDRTVAHMKAERGPQVD